MGCDGEIRVGGEAQLRPNEVWQRLSLTEHRVAKSVERSGLSRQWEARTEVECAGYLRNGLLRRRIAAAGKSCYQAGGNTRAG
jgi:hypothetical protein